jgi:uncharacterized protein
MFNGRNINMIFHIVDYILFIIGLNFILRIYFELFDLLYALASNTNLNKYGKGSLALITGSTDGIGQGFADILAKEGFNIVQVSRNKEKLLLTGTNLETKYGIKVRNITKDFGLSNKNPLEFYNDIFEQTKDIDISIVFNNVGIDKANKAFIDLKLEDVLEVVNINVLPVVFLSRLYLPKLINRPQGGALINMSSILSKYKLPDKLLYCCTKAFDHSLTEVIKSEIAIRDLKKVDVISLRPGFVDTNLTKKNPVKFLSLDRYQYATSAIKGFGSNTNYLNGHWKHSLTEIIVPILLIFRKRKIVKIKH